MTGLSPDALFQLGFTTSVLALAGTVLTGSALVFVYRSSDAAKLLRLERRVTETILGFSARVEACERTARETADEAQETLARITTERRRVAAAARRAGGGGGSDSGDVPNPLNDPNATDTEKREFMRRMMESAS